MVMHVCVPTLSITTRDRREEHYVGTSTIEMKVQGISKRGRHKRRWLTKVRYDIKEKELSPEDVYDRVTWRRMSSYIDPT